ncbi:site-2 protease family protein [Candidatus Woesearchaeota archaeon]|nr:site-2 protease family protein [Candidatus Woesearchaeota archaeon]
MSLLSFFVENKWVLLFYGLIVLLVYLNRHRFQVQNKIIMMYKTKIGLGLMDRIGVRHAELVKFVAYCGIGIGFAGMLLIFYTLIKNLISLLSVPDAQSAVSLIVPGIALPGSPIKIPLISGWIALFFVILVHEFSHGIVARAHNLAVKSSGIFFFGPLMGAFVEPEEKKLLASPDTTQYSVYAAGPFSNILLAIFAILILSYALTPIVSALTVPVGVTLAGVSDKYPSQAAGLASGMLITQLNSKNITNYEEFQSGLSCVKPGDTVSLVANGTLYTIVAAAHPEKPDKGYLGVLASSAATRELKTKNVFTNLAYPVLLWIVELFYILAILSLGIGLANLLPLGPVDGGRMTQTALERTKGKERGAVWWKKLTIITFFILIINLFWPLIKWVGGLLGLLM